MEDEDQIITQQPQHSSPFDAIRQVDEHGHEYWSARKLSKILTYDDYRNFQKVMSKAIRSCESAGEEASDHFVEVTNMITVGESSFIANRTIVLEVPPAFVLSIVDQLCQS